MSYTIILTNYYDVEVKSIKGQVKIKDSENHDLKSVKCDYIGVDLKAGESIMEDLVVKINPNSENDLKIYNSNIEDLIFMFKKTQVIDFGGRLL